MGAKAKDPTAAMRERAASYEGVEVGTSCSQTSYKTKKSAFLYVGMQGGRHKAMFKLAASREQAAALAAKHPDDYQVGKTSWVTVRFSAAKPVPKTRWQRWLKESYELSV